MTRRICLAFGCIFLVATTSKGSAQVSARTIVDLVTQPHEVSSVAPVYQLVTTATTKSNTSSENKEEIKSSEQRELQVKRTGETRRLNPFKMLTIASKPRVSPLYLINGTVCRFINFQPVCTTLSTTGLSVGAGGAPASGGAGGGAARPAAGGGAAGAAGSRPAAAGVSTGGGSSVQFANQPTRNVVPTAAAAMGASEQPEVFVERRDNGTSEGGQAGGVLVAARPPLGVVLRRRPLRPFLTLNRRPAVNQVSTTSRSQEAQTKKGKTKGGENKF